MKFLSNNGLIYFWSKIKALLEKKAEKNNPVFTGSISLGRKSGTAVGDSSVALGCEVTASYDRTIAIGHRANSSSKGSIAIGDTVSANSDYNIAIGEEAHAVGSHSVALGHNVRAQGTNQVVLGTFNQENTTSAFIFGNGINNGRHNLFELIDTNEDGNVMRVNGNKMGRGLLTLWTGASGKVTGLILPENIFYNNGKSAIIVINAFLGLEEANGVYNPVSGELSNINISEMVGINLGDFGVYSYNPIYGGETVWSGKEQYAFRDKKRYSNELFLNITKSASNKRLTAFFGDCTLNGSQMVFLPYITSISAILI